MASTASNQTTPPTYKELVSNLAFWKRKYQALAVATESLEKEVETLRRDIVFLKAKGEQSVSMSDTKDRVIHGALEEANKQNNLYLEEINALGEEVRRLKRGDNDRMGNEDNQHTQG